jgi:predicted FMN-binding regulatory protein PaiB
MYLPPCHRVNEDTWHRRIMAEHPWATLVANGETLPYPARLPALVPPDESVSGPLAGPGSTAGSSAPSRTGRR